MLHLEATTFPSTYNSTVIFNNTRLNSNFNRTGQKFSQHINLDITVSFLKDRHSTNSK